MASVQHEPRVRSIVLWECLHFLVNIEILSPVPFLICYLLTKDLDSAAHITAKIWVVPLNYSLPFIHVHVRHDIYVYANKSI